MTHEYVPDDPAGLAAELAPRLAMLRVLANCGHITKAAEQLGVAQPTLSRQLAALGESLGTEIVTKDGRGIRLTRVGRLLGEVADDGLAAIEAGCRRVVEELDPQRGHVVLGFLSLLGRAIVPDLLHGFRQRFPDVRFSLQQSSRQEVLDMLRGNRVDLAMLAPLPTEYPELDSIAFASEELKLVVPPGHRLAARPAVRMVDLADEDFVGLVPGFGLRKITDELCAEAGFAARMAFEGQESYTVRGLVAAGLGVAILPSSEPGSAPVAVEIPIIPTVHRTIGLSWLRGQRLTPAARAFREHVRAAAH
ncbi:DNA-binding transcriptional LysR family regulator [Tamaricihabitans halophyticus]|uniref:DNA-binding transcriptional LysR family regulator n=1 Tax=Tamaricihabitans halophyticus TaxID=1262583 RepID=A0A4R2R158_9PSEU|nr:LysR family transcriptional regulator [Tamaricihabitans halophyticus]TCP56223.1 DNA-binding transcriptional LysR family regulator [Tamaricihabitans halophyticus]